MRFRANTPITASALARCGRWPRGILLLIGALACMSVAAASLEERARQGDSTAQFDLATTLLAKGDREDAARWLREASAQGHPLATAMLGAVADVERLSPPKDEPETTPAPPPMPITAAKPVPTPAPAPTPAAAKPDPQVADTKTPVAGAPIKALTAPELLRAAARAFARSDSADARAAGSNIFGEDAVAGFADCRSGAPRASQTSRETMMFGTEHTRRYRMTLQCRTRWHLDVWFVDVFGGTQGPHSRLYFVDAEDGKHWSCDSEWGCHANAAGAANNPFARVELTADPDTNARLLDRVTAEVIDLRRRHARAERREQERVEQIRCRQMSADPRIINPC